MSSFPFLTTFLGFVFLIAVLNFSPKSCLGDFSWNFEVIVGSGRGVETGADSPDGPPFSSSALNYRMISIEIVTNWTSKNPELTMIVFYMFKVNVSDFVKNGQNT